MSANVDDRNTRIAGETLSFAFISIGCLFNKSTQNRCRVPPNFGFSPGQPKPARTSWQTLSLLTLSSLVQPVSLPGVEFLPGVQADRPEAAAFEQLVRRHPHHAVGPVGKAAIDAPE